MTQRPRYYECGICGHIHPWEFNGDCRADDMRFTVNEIEAKHSKTGFEVLTMDERVEADNAEA